MALIDPFPSLPDVCTEREIAEHGGPALRTIRKWRAEGRLRSYHLGKRVYIHKADLLALLRPEGGDAQ